MMDDGIRICDICAAEIPVGALYEPVVLAPEAAAALLDTDTPELVPTWTQKADLSVWIDVCLRCLQGVRRIVLRVA